MATTFKHFIKSALRYFNLEVIKTNKVGRKHYLFPSCIERLEHASKIGFNPAVVIDGGAFKGLWSIGVKNIFPSAHFILIEPNNYLLETISKNTINFRPPAIVENVALGDEKGTTGLNIWSNVENDQGASVLDHVQGNPGNTIEIKMNTLDNIAASHDLKPDLVKLDHQGAEVMALQGATNILKKTEMFIIEFGCLDAYIERATPHDIINLMYENDYCLYDIVDLNYRPFDGALSGGDFFFIKNWSKLRDHKDYK
jgi:FkbM family methyltransferase